MSNTALRKDSFDTLKFLLAFLVVFQHTGFTGDFGLGCMAVARITVPLFFMITGYYLPTMPDDKFKKHFYKIVYLTVISTFFYSVFDYTRSIFGESSFNWFSQTFDLKNVTRWLLLNSTDHIIAYHLWYFYAIIYVLIIIYIAKKNNKMGFLFKVMPFLILGHYLINNFSGIYYRNFLFSGLPHVLLGYVFRVYEKQLLNICHSSRTLIYNLIVICICICLELLVYKTTGVKVLREYYLFTAPALICVFLLVIKHPNWGAGSIFSKIGKKYSGHIYIMHVFTMYLIQYGLIFIFGNYTYLKIMQNNIFKNSYAFIVFGFTLLIVYIGNNLLDSLLVWKKTKR